MSSHPAWSSHTFSQVNHESAKTSHAQSGPDIFWAWSSHILSQVQHYFKPSPGIFWAMSSQVQTWPASHICASAFVQTCLAFFCHVSHFSHGHLARFAQQVQLARSKAGMIMFSHVQPCPVMATYRLPMSCHISNVRHVQLNPAKLS